VYLQDEQAMDGCACKEIATGAVENCSEEKEGYATLYQENRPNIVYKTPRSDVIWQRKDGTRPFNCPQNS
jgi:hypothetical protein